MPQRQTLIFFRFMPHLGKAGVSLPVLLTWKKFEMRSESSMEVTVSIQNRTQDIIPNALPHLDPERQVMLSQILLDTRLTQVIESTTWHRHFNTSTFSHGEHWTCLDCLSPSPFCVALLINMASKPTFLNTGSTRVSKFFLFFFYWSSYCTEHMNYALLDSASQHIW